MRIGISELRIGNWVNLATTKAMSLVYYEKQIDRKMLIAILDRQLEWDHKGIPLTEDWLLKFGFTKESGKEGYEWVKGWFSIGELNDCYFLEIGSDKKKSIKLYFVHQLQNAFSLTGEELILK